MTKFTIDLSAIGGIDATSANDSWILQKDIILAYNNVAVINGASVDANRTFIINGAILATDGAYGLVAGATGARTSGNTITVGKSGVIDSITGTGVFGEGSNFTIDILGTVKGGHGLKGDIDQSIITNSGLITGKFAGVQLGGPGNTLTNNGTIKATDGNAVYMEEGGNRLTNTGTISTTSLFDATLRLASQTDDSARFNNSGTVTSKSQAILGGEGNEIIANSGKITGSISLGLGTDTFTNSGRGTVSGTIAGGNDSDTYTVNSTKLKLVELLDEGIDTVKSSITWKLGNNLETLILTGKANINGTGNDLFFNTLTGNDGNNTLSGLGGADDLSGGKGRDVLIGGDDADLFHFQKGFGNDTIRDYEDGIDHILLKGPGTATFAEIKSHMRQVGDDVTITLSANDVLTILDTDKGDLRANDFML